MLQSPTVKKLIGFSIRKCFRVWIWRGRLPIGRRPGSENALSIIANCNFYFPGEYKAVSNTPSNEPP